jgi:hypothetical protein
VAIGVFTVIAALAIGGLATEGVSALASLSAYRLPMATIMGTDAGGSGIELSRRGTRTGGAATGLASAGIEGHLRKACSSHRKAPEQSFQGRSHANIRIVSMKTTIALVVLMIVVFLMLAVLANVRLPLMASPFPILAEATV